VGARFAPLRSETRKTKAILKPDNPELCERIATFGAQQVRGSSSTAESCSNTLLPALTLEGG